jgi:signal transduction histidine kinase
VLLQDQSDFEERERVLFAVVLVGFVLSLALAVFLGWVLARKVMAPVVRLARQVRHRDQLLGWRRPWRRITRPTKSASWRWRSTPPSGRLRQALTREQLFTSDVSHELRTPLMVLASSCELLLENPAIDQRGRARSSDRPGQRGNARAGADLPDARPRSARRRRFRAAADPCPGGRRTAGYLARTDRAKGLRLIFEPGNPPDTCYNATLLHAVMGNLLRNACITPNMDSSA